ncbi:MAG: sterol desaturase family protein [Calothrix sp. MO_167.B12]|nr:sterol desaturase family protein [Calothrix sp. MO_167.B12]
MKRKHRFLATRWLISQLFVIAGIAILVVLSAIRYAPGIFETIVAMSQDGYIAKAIWNTCRELVKDVVFNPVLYLMVLAILVLELWMPANKKQKVFSPGFGQDFIWFIGDFFLKALLLIPFVMLLRGLHSQFLSQFSINLPSLLHLPKLVTLTLAILITDFGAWLAHVLQHKIPFLWRFHAIHHSQCEMNLFTDARFHFGDALIGYPLQIFPLYWLLIPLPQGIYYIFFRTWYPRLYHANLRTNFGFLRYVLVTPQSHRIHHSIEVRHFDKNFGIVFSIWDYIFGTQHRDFHEYPDTGIHDQNFPTENGLSFWCLPKNYVSQLLYPFRLSRD